MGRVYAALSEKELGFDLGRCDAQPSWPGASRAEREQGQGGPKGGSGQSVTGGSNKLVCPGFPAAACGSPHPRVKGQGYAVDGLRVLTLPKLSMNGVSACAPGPVEA
jgi:hypothetical protein